MFKEIEMQMFFNDLISSGTEYKLAIKQTLATFRKQYAVNFS